MYIGKHLSAENTISALNALIDVIEDIFDEMEKQLAISEVMPEKKWTPTRRECARRQIHLRILPVYELHRLPDFLRRHPPFPEVMPV